MQSKKTGNEKLYLADRAKNYCWIGVIKHNFYIDFIIFVKGERINSVNNMNYFY